jgi:hypothetical protein
MIFYGAKQKSETAFSSLQGSRAPGIIFLRPYEHRLKVSGNSVFCFYINMYVLFQITWNKIMTFKTLHSRLLTRDVFGDFMVILCSNRDHTLRETMVISVKGC